LLAQPLELGLQLLPFAQPILGCWYRGTHVGFAFRKKSDGFTSGYTPWSRAKNRSGGRGVPFSIWRIRRRVYPSLSASSCWPQCFSRHRLNSTAEKGRDGSGSAREGIGRATSFRAHISNR